MYVLCYIIRIRIVGVRDVWHAEAKHASQSERVRIELCVCVYVRACMRVCVHCALCIYVYLCAFVCICVCGLTVVRVRVCGGVNVSTCACPQSDGR